MSSVVESRWALVFLMSFKVLVMYRLPLFSKMESPFTMGISKCLFLFYGPISLIFSEWVS